MPQRSHTPRSLLTASEAPFLLLLRGFSFPLFLFGSRQVFFIFLRAFAVARPSFFQGDCDGLPFTLHRLSGAGFQLAMLVFMHDAADRFLLLLRILLALFNSSP